MRQTPAQRAILNNSYIVLLSGGLDSVVNFHAACESGTVPLALTFNYGQRSFKKELEAAAYFCSKLDVKHKVIELLWLQEMTRSALVNKGEKMPSLKNLDDMTEANASAKAVWVPNRNGAFLNIAAAFAESMGVEFIVPGFNKEEAATFPDNSQSFIEAMNKALELSTMSGVKVFCFTTDLDKTAMVKKALGYGIDLDRVWSCYLGDEKKCGACESCQRTARAMALAR